MRKRGVRGAGWCGVLLVLGLWTLDALSQSQHIEIGKNPRDPVTVDFWNLPTDLTTFDGLVLEAATAIGGPYTDVSVSMQKTDHSITFPAPDTPRFYRLYYFKMVDGVKQRSPSSNSAAVFIVNTGLPVN